ncbi:MAG: type III polyketide synthase [Phycisphaerales bacterium]|nr:MAG: type III polyketide synthase [Phycisphaerales bacterium]
MSARLWSIGTATPAGLITQGEVADLACRVSGENARERALRVIYRRAGVVTRGSVLVGADGKMEMFEPPPGGSVSGGPTTGERLAAYPEAASELARRACETALERAGVRAPRVTHLITVSCTGFDAPGVDCALVASLGLPATVRRTHVGFMGCHGAINALAAARAYAEADPSACVLVCCVELCTLHFQYSDEASVAVANALFADGAAAAVVASGDGPRGSLIVRGVESVIIPGTRDCMTWRIGDHGFVMTLSSRVPEVLAAEVPGWVRGWLPRYGFGVADVRSWAVHPGGPRVVSSVAEGLGLDASSVSASREVLAEHGNMSSPTVLFIAERQWRAGDGAPLVAMAFGPGLTGEALLLTP